MHDTPILIGFNAKDYWSRALAWSVLGGLAAAWITYDGAPRWFGWTIIVACGWVAGVALLRLCDRRPRVVIDADGVFDRLLGTGTIPWSDIHDANLVVIRRRAFIGLGLVHRERWLARMSWRKRWLARMNARFGFRAINVSLGGTTLDADRTLAAVRRWLAHERGR